jgi:hypothetical protein
MKDLLEEKKTGLTIDKHEAAKAIDYDMDKVYKAIAPYEKDIEAGTSSMSVQPNGDIIISVGKKTVTVKYKDIEKLPF